MQFDIRRFSQVSSTNDEAIRLAKEGVSEGTVIIADFQTQGRGRGENVWVSKEGKDLLMSLVVRPKCDASKVSGLTLMTAQAIEKFLKRHNIPAAIKCPNDLLVGGRKISGILTESQTQGKRIEWCVIGVGLNINSGVEDIPEGSTSMGLELDQTFDREAAEAGVLELFNREYEAY